MIRASRRAALVAVFMVASILLIRAQSAPANGSHPKTRALVLGGGGPVGEAWESGIIAGLAEKGVDLSNSDLIVGTSAGAIVGARFAMGTTPADLVKAALIRSDGPTSAHPTSTPSPDARPPDLSKMIDTLRGIAAGKWSPEQAREKLGQWALKVLPVVTEAQFVSSYTRRFPDKGWPGHGYECTTVDTSNGSFGVWNEASGVPLDRAVASSCALPGLFAPITINGHRYMDGGIPSATNADLARDYKTVVVIAPTVGPSDEVARLFSALLNSELKTLRDSGSKVEMIVPDAASVVAFGPSLGNEGRRLPAADAGLAQGRNEAARIRPTWSN